MGAQPRVPAGRAGGQFAPKRSAEAVVALDDWMEDGVTPHPTGGYVRVERLADRVTYRNAEWSEHRLDGPAIELDRGHRFWMQHGTTHRLDGPAAEYPDGSTYWVLDGLRHRVGGPAIERPDGYRAWFQDGRLHNLDGPAIERPDGTVEYWVEGREVTEDEFEVIAGTVLA